MGEVQGLFFDDQGIPSLDFDSESKGFRTFTIVGQRIFVVGGSDNASASSLSVQIFDKSLGKWYTPSVVGTRPAASTSHSAVLLNENKIIILKRDAPPDDSIWFLEVGTPFVRERAVALETEVIAWSKGMVGEALKPVVISGPSGVGKGTLISRLMADFPLMFGFSVSHTTRAPREQEINGVHYHFMERSIMEKDIEDGKFLESAHVHGNLYGTSIEAVETVTDSGRRCILDIDVQGARSVKASSIDVVSIFIRPPSFEELEKRLRARGTETEEQIQKRLNNARAELEQGQNSGIFDHILENDNLETCYVNLKKILGLDGSVTKSSSCLNGTSDKLIDEKGQKILVQLGAAEVGRAANNLFTLDLSSISGGAPGRTRGLKVYPMDSFTDESRQGAIRP